VQTLITILDLKDKQGERALNKVKLTATEVGSGQEYTAELNGHGQATFEGLQKGKRYALAADLKTT
jgi:hypothetical protein